MKRYISLLLALVMVVGMIPATAVLAEENAAPVLAEENFDDVALEFPSVDTIDGVGEYTAAQIKADPAREGYALWAGDEEGAIVPALTYTFDSTSNVTVEFDVNVSDPNALNVLRLYNDDYTNFQKVAISLNFSNQGLRYYNGSAWTAYDKNVTLPVNEWVKIRIELIPGKSGEAKIYMDDVNVLTIPGSELLGTMANNANSVNGIYFASNKADRTFYLDNLKIDAAPYQATETPTSATGFEAMEAGVLAGDPIVSASQAIVETVTNADESTNNVLHLDDQSETAAAVAGLTVKDSEVLTATFKYKGVKGALQMYITDGGRSTANSAYFLQFSGKNVQYYDGAAWQTLVTLDYFLTAWTNIKIEAGLETAKIYIKNELVAEAPRAGGSYGTNVKNALDSIYFVIGSSASASTSNCYLDDVSLAGNTRDVTVTPYVGTDFESMTVDAAPTAPVVDNLQTVVISRVNGSGKLAAQVCDQVAAGAGRMRLALPEKTDKMVVEFDLVAWVGEMQFAITNGGQSTANMAYWLRIRGQYIQYYSGSKWEDLKVMDAALAAGWHKVRIEADLEKADWYIDGELMGSAARATGSYGTNVKTNFDSVVFISGGNNIDTHKYIVDNVSVTGKTYNVIVTPELIEENFDSYAPVASAESVESIVAAKEATIVENPMGEGNVLLLHTETSTGGGTIDLAYDLVDSYVLEYDAMIPAAADICMQIYAGRGGNKEAYVLAFNRAYGLRVLSLNAENKNEWINLEQTATKPSHNEWHKIRVEVNMGDEQAASVYLDGQLIATTSVTYNRVNELAGAYIYSGGAGQKVYLDNMMVTGVAAEDEGIDGVVDTEVGLMLEQDVTIDELTIDPETILDLNGYTLTVNNLVVYGSIIDTSENNAGKLIAENVIFSNMGYMPVYDSANGWYKFYEYTLENLGVRGNADGSVTYGFAINFVNAEAYDLLATSGSGVTVNMNLAWGENSRLFAFDAALVQQYAALQAKYPVLRAAMMLTVSGLDTLEAGQTVSVTPVVEAAGVADSGEAMVYTVS